MTTQYKIRPFSTKGENYHPAIISCKISGEWEKEKEEIANIFGRDKFGNKIEKNTNPLAKNLLEVLPKNFCPYLKKNGVIFMEKAQTFLKKKGWVFFNVGLVKRGKFSRIKTGKPCQLDKESAGNFWVILGGKDKNGQKIDLVHNTKSYRVGWNKKRIERTKDNTGQIVQEYLAILSKREEEKAEEEKKIKKIKGRARAKRSQERAKKQAETLAEIQKLLASLK